ncbi:MAG TPA: oligosaccharide flippase family protein [Edaphocola sp.]|nr:oligosaccharide flippase family protein [Edaphocola sp.]
MRKFFVGNIVFLLLVNLVVKPVWIFGIDRNVQNFVGHAAYGQYQAILSFCIIFQIFLDFGLQNFNNRTVAQSPEVIQTLFPNILWAKVFLSLGYYALLFLLGFLIGFRGHALWLLLLLGFVQILSSLVLYLRSNVSALHRFKMDSLLSVSDKLIMIIICGVLLYLPPWSRHFRIEWFVYAQIVSYFLTALIAFVTCIKLSRLKWHRFHPQKAWAICKQSLPYAILIFSMSVYLRADSVILERLLPDGKEQAGIFAASFRLLDAANNFTGVLFAGILLPMFGRLLAKKEAVQPLVRQSVNLLLPVAFTTVAIAIFWGNDIMQVLYRDMTGYDAKIFAVIMCAYPGFCIGYVYATLLTANGNLRPLIYVALIAVTINLGLNFILIPRTGALGAAYSCAITQVFLSIVNIWLAGRYIRLKKDFGWVLQYLAFIVLMVIVGILLDKSGWSLSFKLLGMAVNGLLCMMICGFVPFAKILQITKTAT